MKNKHFTVLAICFAIVLFLFVLSGQHKERVIIYPEELNVAKESDTMRIEKINRDTIWLGYYNLINR